MAMPKRKLYENFVWISYADLVTGVMISLALILVVTEKSKSNFAERAIADVDKARRSFNKVNDAVIKLVNKKLDCRNVKVSKRDTQPQTIQITYREGDESSWFSSGSYELREHAKTCLSVFGKIWLREMYRENQRQQIKIKSLIVEGHTDSRARAGVQGHGEEANFLDNLELSQQRAFAATHYIFRVTPASHMSLPHEFDIWKRKTLSANGRSFADRIYKKGKEDFANSRRVEFKYTLQHDYGKYHELKKNY